MRRSSIPEEVTHRLVESLVLCPALGAAVGHTVTARAVVEPGLVGGVADQADPGVGQTVALVLAQFPAQ